MNDGWELKTESKIHTDCHHKPKAHFLVQLSYSQPETGVMEARRKKPGLRVHHYGTSDFYKHRQLNKESTNVFEFSY